MDEIAKELKIRKRIAGIFNKTEQDFSTKDQWDDYLESVEDLVYNLVNNIDVAATEAKVSEYERANRASIIANQARVVEAQRKAQVEAFQATAAAAAASTGADAAPSATGYAPSMAPMMAAQPRPVKEVAEDRDGNIVWQKRFRPDALHVDAPAARAAGWGPDLPRARALAEAFGSLLLLGPTAA